MKENHKYSENSDNLVIISNGTKPKSKGSPMRKVVKGSFDFGDVSSGGIPEERVGVVFGVVEEEEESRAASREG